MAKVEHILLIDDEPSVLFALKLLLEASGFKVKDFSSGDPALSWLKSAELVDVCICDLRMPQLSGVQVLEQALKIRLGLPFVLMSGHADSEEVQHAKKLGAYAFLAKPFTPGELQQLIDQLES